MGDIKITNPSPDSAAEMGIRDWPQQLKKGTWDENAGEGQTLVRYVLDGTGSLEITTGATNDGNDDDSSPKTTTTNKLAPGTLIEVTGESTLSWRADDEIIILTPGFEEGGKFLGVLALMVVSFVALLASGGL